MQKFTSLPDGYRKAESSDRKQFKNRELRGGLAIKEHEILILEEFIVKDDGFIDSDGVAHQSFRFSASSSIKPRLLKLDVFNCYPKERTAWLSQTKFGQDILNFSGNQDDLIDFLLTKKIECIKIEMLDYLPFGSTNYEQKRFALFEYAQ